MRRSSCRIYALFDGGKLTGLVKFDAEETLRLIERERVQWVNFVPTMMHRIWALPENVRNAYDVSSLQIVFHMAAPMPPWLKENWIAWLGPERVWELYGGTERQGACIISGVEWLAHKGSVGKIGETARLRIIGEDGNDVAPGETGEIYFLHNDGTGTHLSLSRRRAEASRRRLGIARRYRPAGCRRLSLSRRPPRRHGAARRRQHLSGRGRGRGRAYPGVRSCVVVGLPDPEFGQRVHAIIEPERDADGRRSPMAWPTS